MFGRVATQYAKARPTYPEALIDDLAGLCGMGPGTAVLEIGPGTGQLTTTLADLGCRVLAVELSDELAGIARTHLSGRENVEVIVADFDSWAVPSRAFDVVVAATSFHWLDPGTRTERCHGALRPGGALAVVDTTWGVRSGTQDEFFVRSQDCYARWDPEHSPEVWHPTLKAVRGPQEELTESRLFREVEQKRYMVRRSYTRTQFIQLVSTYSTVLSWPSNRRQGFLECMAELIDEEFNGTVERHDLYELSVARA